MTQCVNATELHMDSTISHVDLKQGTDSFFFLKKGVCPHPAFLSSEEVHKRALGSEKILRKG